MRTLAFHQKSWLVVLVALVAGVGFDARAGGQFSITGQSVLIFCQPIPGTDAMACGMAGVPSQIDVYSDRGVLVTQSVCTNGYVAVEGLKPGTYNLVGTCLSPIMPFFGTNGPVSGTFTTATQTVTVRNKNSSEVDLVFYFVPDP